MIKKLGRPDLITTVNRSVSNEYVKADVLDEVIDLIYGQARQRLIGE